MENKVYIRADGSSQIGLGHLVRCIALAHMIKSDFDVCFVCKEAPETIQQEIDTAGFSFKQINRDEEFFELLHGKEIVVLDHYGLDSAYQKRVKEIGCKLVCIDDLHDKEFYADLIINHAPGIQVQNYKAQPYTQFALGTDYALLRPVFLEAAEKKQRIDKIESVLICFGGADSKNLTHQTLEAVLKYSDFKKAIVITGSAYQYGETLNRLTKDNAKVEHYHSIEEKTMAELMLKCDLAIVPASGILFEALVICNKVISGFYTSNQKLIYEGFLKAGLIIGADNFSLEEIIRAMENVDNRYKRNIFDQKSGDRILEKFRSLV